MLITKLSTKYLIIVILSKYCSTYRGLDHAKALNTKGPVIGRYERDEMKPSIETAAKLAQILEVSLDYLVGATDMEVDAKTLNRVVELQKLPSEIREKLYFFIDMSIRDYKAKTAYAS